ncbi:MAG: ATP-dependent DNA helicase RecQ [Deltaproteobacteria bacterium]|nr:ATP-dependent DNA helicase RecQ [Deltaproteobacteria bacterium]
MGEKDSSAQPSGAEISCSLAERFGHAGFLPGQEQVVRAVLDGQDCLVVMPTGGGKSLCYQLPAVLRAEGVTLVISPLIALMKDQVDALEARGIAATFLNSSLGWDEMAARLEQMAHGQFRLVYIAPERFRNERFLDALGPVKVELFAVDEAHCISTWGHDFRPDYLRLRQAIERVGRPQVIALTATATPEVCADIADQLGLAAPRIFVRGFARPNLALGVHAIRSHEEKLRRTLEILSDCHTAIVYCATRASADKTRARLAANGIDCLAYHAGLPDGERQSVQERFMAGGLPVVVATNAFGMGIDRADLRAVVHWDVPGSLEAYYQEAGRAGRDGQPARCELLYTYADARTHEFFIQSSAPDERTVMAVLEAFEALCAQRGAVPTAVMIAARLGPGVKRVAVSSALTQLRRAGAIETGAGEAARGADPDRALEEVLREAQQRAERERSRLRRMLRYADSRECRHAFILRYFGDPEGDEVCGRCDNCLRRDRPSALGRAPDEAEWIQIQKVLSCVARLHGRFGRARVTQVLAGSRLAEVLRLRLDRLPTYGALSDCSQARIRSLIEALVDADCIATRGDEYPTLVLTSKGREVMHRRREVLLALAPPRARPAPSKAKSAAPKTPTSGPLSAPPSPLLVEALRALRNRLARQRGVPAYAILTNATLQAVAAAAPRDEAELLAVKGIGPAKLEDLGREILQTVASLRAAPGGQEKGGAG